MQTPPRARYFFCHLQKTAGRSLYRRLVRHFGETRVYPNTSDGDIARSVISVTHLLSRWRARAEEIDVVTGHFPLCTQDLLDGSFRAFTTLREPVARTLSYLRHYRRLTPEVSDWTLERIYDADRLRFHGLIHNHMVKMLSLTTAEMVEGALTHVTFTSANLARAKQALETIDVVGLQEEFETFCEELTQRFGFRLGSPIVANTTAPVEVSAAFKRRILRDNALDVELYQFARHLVADRRQRSAGAAL